MDRVQKSKLSLYKKAMEVGARLLDILGWQGPGCVPQETWGGHRAQGLPQTLTQGHAQCSRVHLVPRPHKTRPGPAPGAPD